MVPVRKVWGLNFTNVAIPGVLSSARADPGWGVEELKSYECSSILVRLFSNSLRKTYTFYVWYCDILGTNTEEGHDTTEHPSFIRFCRGAVGFEIYGLPVTPVVRL